MIKSHTMEYRPSKQWLPTRQMFPDMYGNDVTTTTTLSHIQQPSFSQRQNYVSPPLRHLDVTSPYSDVPSPVDVNPQDVSTTYSDGNCSYARAPYTNFTPQYVGNSSRFSDNSCPDMYNGSYFHDSNSTGNGAYLASPTELRQHGHLSLIHI